MAAAKTARPHTIKKTGRTAKVFHLDSQLCRLLAIYALGQEKNQSEIVSEALEPLVRGWYVAFREQGGKIAGGPPARPDSPQIDPQPSAA
jgi:hypothetical protein